MALIVEKNYNNLNEQIKNLVHSISNSIFDNLIDENVWE